MEADQLRKVLCMTVFVHMQEHVCASVCSWMWRPQSLLPLRTPSACDFLFHLVLAFLVSFVLWEQVLTI